MLGADVLNQARRQSRPRRWPWQPKTARDYVDAYRADLTALVSQQGATLLAEVQRQSHRRRWPWQPKTIRDLLEERSTEVVALAAEWSADLAEAVANRAAALRATAQQQSRPRRWPWQAKTLRDRVSERNVELATRAAERSAKLALLARQRREALLKELRRQSRPRRWPWQPKTLRDQIGERGKQAISATDRLTHLTNSSAHSISQAASAVGERMQQLVSTTPSAIDSATTTAASALKEASQNVSTALNTTAETAAATVQRPVAAVSDKVQAGRRRVRRGVRLVRTALWFTLIGMVLGLLFAKTSGAELRRQIGTILDQIAQSIHWQMGEMKSN